MSHNPPHSFLRWAAGLVVVGLAAGCGGVSIDPFGQPPTGPDASADAAPPPTDLGPGACVRNADCPSGQWCAGEGCEAAGRCAPRPDACTTEDSPVCGCDGLTYGNACAASAAGVRAASRGACTTSPPPVDAGPGGCATSSDCGSGNECVYPDTACARSGTCAPRIECFRAETFCSCAGVTYAGCRPDRPTSARAACAPPPADAGTSFCATVRCASGTVCCEAARACIRMGALCIAPPPVDAGVDAGPGQCRSNADCGARQWCAGTGCGTPGTCQALGDVCTTLYSPVCGCDGRTYSNDCVANVSGVRVASRGACAGVDAGVDAGPALFCPTALCAAGTRCCEALRRCMPAGVLCPSEPPDAGPTGCATAADCGSGNECVYPDTACARSGTCMARIECFRAETFCSCAGVTYSGCRPDRPTSARAACAPPPVDAGTSFCAAATCPTGTTCCEAARACIRMGAACIAPAPDAGVDAGPAGCTTALDCAGGNECVFPDTACARTGVCMTRIACFVAQPFCSCTGETYRGCRPDRPTSASGECPPTPVDAGTSFCAMVRCAAGFVCCEAARACIPMGAACIAPAPDAGVDAGPATCASDRDCASGLSCCTSSGRCYDTRCLACCMPRATSCATNADCPARQWCAGTGCGTAGTCTALAEICTTLYAPVCGCDRRTYSNECVANAAGVRVASRGACP